MPEGDTIWRTAAALRARLAGRTVVRASPAALDRVVGLRVDAVEAEGKHLLVRFSRGEGRMPLVLHSHMRMTGAWHLYAPSERWRRPAHRARVVLEVEDAVAVCFDAPVVQIAGVPGQAEFHCRALREIAIAHALHAPADDPPLCVICLVR